jgi:hypothetical protein
MTLMVTLMDGEGTGDLGIDSFFHSSHSFSHSSSSAASFGNMFWDTQCSSHHCVSLVYDFYFMLYFLDI